MYLHPGASKMRAKVQRWGNSLGVRLPKKLADDVHVADGSLVELSVERGRLLLSPIVEPTYTLAELVAGISPRNRHASVDWGPARGHEVW
jgi:antitoxin MazE